MGDITGCDLVLILEVLRDCKKRLSLMPSRERDVFKKLQALEGYLVLKYRTHDEVDLT